MASDVMRVRLHLCQIRVLAVASDTPSELRVEVESTVRRPRCSACGFGCVRVHDTRRRKVRDLDRTWTSWTAVHARARFGRWNRWLGSRQARRAERLSSAQLRHALRRAAPSPLRCGSGSRRRIGALTGGSWSGGIRLSGLGVPSWWCRIMIRLRRWTRWWGCMMSCGWHTWPARSSRANLSRPVGLARLQGRS